MSGLSRTPGKRVYVNSVSRVRIPSSLPNTNPKLLQFGIFCYLHIDFILLRKISHNLLPYVTIDYYPLPFFYGMFCGMFYPLPKPVRTQKAYPFKRYCSTCCRETEPDTETRRGDMPLEKWRQFLDWIGKTPSETASRSRKARPNKKYRLKFFRRHRVSFKH